MTLGGAPLQLDVSQLLGATVDGVAFGIFLALLGVGITLVFGLGEVLNLAIGTFAVISGLVAVTLWSGGANPLLAGLGGVLAVGVLGVVVDRALLSFVYRSEGEERILVGIFVTLGLAILLDGALNNFYPGSYSLRVDLPRFTIGSAPISGSSLLVIGVGVVTLAVLFVFLEKTFLGQATRTVFQDEVGALLVGVEPRRVRALVFVLSSLVAGVAGAVFVVSRPYQIVDGFEFTTFALIVSIVGGVRNVRGAVVSGLFLGLVIQYANFFIGTFVAKIILFVTAILALLIRPEVFS